MFDESYYRLIDQLPPIRYVVSFSTGASSAVTAKRAIDRYGKANVDIVFMDTTVEDIDNYRFLRDCESYFDSAITVLRDGRTPLEVAEQQHIIPNQRIAPCTRELKIKPFLSYLQGLRNVGEQPVALLGMGWREKHRMAAPRKNYGAIGVWVDYPLVWYPIIGDPVAEVKAWGMTPPRTYAMGFTHANCIGGGQDKAAGCVKFGARDWKRMLEHFPDIYAVTETWEARMREDERFADYALLRDSTGGTVKAKTLAQLKTETRAADERQLKLFDLQDDLDFGCSLECGAA